MATATKANGRSTEVIPTLSEALLKAQSAMPPIPKDATNPHFKNKYVSLDSLLAIVLPVLNDNGIVAVQKPTYVESTQGELQPALTTTLIHAKTGESVSDTMLLLPSKGDPQGQGGALTYARRYALSSFLGLNSEEDDDGNAASRARQPSDQQFKAPEGAAPTRKDGEHAKLLAEFKKLQPKAAEVDRSWQEEALVTHVSAQLGEALTSFDEFPVEALEQLVWAAKAMVAA